MSNTVAEVGKYESVAAGIGRLVDGKQKAYGDAFSKSGQVMNILYPNGISIVQVDDALCVVRIIDKLFRIATDPYAYGESPYRDIAGYAILGTVRHGELNEITDNASMHKEGECCMFQKVDWVRQIGVEIEHAANVLPDGYRLEIQVEQGYVRVVLFDPTGNQVDFMSKDEDDEDDEDGKDTEDMQLAELISLAAMRVEPEASIIRRILERRNPYQRVEKLKIGA